MNKLEKRAQIEEALDYVTGENERFPAWLLRSWAGIVMRADELVKKHGADLVGRWVMTEPWCNYPGGPSKIVSVGSLDPWISMEVKTLHQGLIGVMDQEQISFLPGHHEWALWLNEHMPSEGQRKWLRMVLDSVPEEKRLLTALELSVAHWHREAVPRGGWANECALCEYSRSISKSGSMMFRCNYCTYNCSGGSSWRNWVYARYDKTKAADAVYEDLKALYGEEWRRVNGPK